MCLLQVFADADPAALADTVPEMPLLQPAHQAGIPAQRGIDD